MKCSTLLLSLALALDSVSAREGCDKKLRESSHKEKEFNLTREYAAEVARGVVKYGDLVHVSTLKDGKTPVTFPEYYVSSDLCEGVNSTGNPILVLMNVSSTLRNYQDNGKLSITVEDRRPRHHAMSSPRANLFGSLKKLETTKALRDCYGKRHPDAIPWLPGEESLVHDGAFYEFEVEDLYYVGGYGFQAYIGDIDGELYHESEPLKLKWGKKHHKGHKEDREHDDKGDDEKKHSKDEKKQPKDDKKHSKDEKKHSKDEKKQPKDDKKHSKDEKKQPKDEKKHSKDEKKHSKDEEKHAKSENSQKGSQRHSGEQHPFANEDFSEHENEKFNFDESWESAKSIISKILNNY